MPEQEGQPPFKIADGIGEARIWQLIEDQVTVVIGCVSCTHFVRWTPQILNRKLARSRGKMLISVAGKLRCGKCRSRYVRIWPG